MTRKIEPTASGTFKVRFRLNKRQTSETFTTRKKAETFARWLDALGAQGALDQLYAAEQTGDVPSLNTVAADHIAHLTGIEEGTRKTYARLWERVWMTRVGYLPANQVSADAIRRAVLDLSTHYSHKSLQNQRGLLAGVVQRAVDEGYLTKNHARGIRLPPRAQ